MSATADQLSRDYVLVVQAAYARANDQPTLADVIVLQAENPLAAALDLVALLLRERQEAKS